MNGIDRIKFLNVPVDNIDQESFTEIYEKMIRDGEKHQIILLNISKLLKAKVNKEYARMLDQASLILPVSKGIVSGIKFQKKGTIIRYNPYELIIKVLHLTEKNNKGVYLLGSEKHYLLEAEKNLRASFPGLKIIGRFTGFFNKNMEQDIKTSVRKSSPALTLVGRGVPGKETWIKKSIKDFNPGIFLWVENYLEIFAGKEKNISKGLFKAGLESLPGIIVKPWKLLKFFPYIYFKLLVLIYKISGK